MEIDANVWAKSSENAPWFRASVGKIEKIDVKTKRNEIENLTKFSLSIQDDLGYPTGRSEEVVTGFVEGSTVDYEFVKLRNLNDQSSDSIHDLTVLNYLHEPAILSCLKVRFDKNIIYTNTGPILIAVNPFKPLKVYDHSNVIKYKEAGELARYKGQISKLPPHVYQVADNAYRNMVEIAATNASGVANQSILVSGESGAGKTVTTKFIMKYLADITSIEEAKKSSGIEQQVLQSNPILECFGNARTLRNDNSSRFGKFIEIKFSPGRGTYYRIIGATIRTYLLERVRLVRQGTGERNFHVFYEITKGGTRDELMKWGIEYLDQFHYTNQSGEECRRDGVDDKDQFKESRQAMVDMGFTTEEQFTILSIVAALLHLGNLKFDLSTGIGEEEDGSKMSPSCLKHLQYCCSLLGCEESKLEKVLCEKLIKTKEKNISKRQTVYEAEHARDTLAKTIYGALFEWIVRRVNAVVGQEMSSSSSSSKSFIPFIGVLDIFGFESFQTNSFEQLCINYTNERLQHHFNEFIFDDEQKLYKRQGISWDFIEFPDNDDVIDLLANKRTGIFALCDEQVLFPRATDLTLVRKFYDNCSSHPRFSAGKVEIARNVFVVRHFAGPVTYSSEGLLEKNYDVLRLDMALLLRESTVPLVSTLYEFLRVDDSELDNPSSHSSSHNHNTARNAMAVREPPRGTKIFTVSGEFRKQLNELMDNIQVTSPHYIRCLKPNSRNQSGIFDDALVIDQLRCNGVLEAVRVSRAGYPNRIPFEQFGRKYAMLTGEERGGTWTKERTTSLCEALSKSALNDAQFTISADALTQRDPMIRAGFQIGTSMVFLRRGTFDYVERGILAFQRAAAVKIQTQYRRHYAYIKYKKMKLAEVVIASNYRCHRARKITRNLRESKARKIIQRVVRGFLARVRVSMEHPNYSRLCQRINEKKMQVKLLDMRRAANVVMVAKHCRQYFLRRRAAQQFKAAVTIQSKVRMFLSRKMLLQKRKEFVKYTLLERKRLQAQIHDEKLKWESERNKLVQVNRQQSVELHEQISKLKAELAIAKEEIEVSKHTSKDWEDRAKSAMKANQERSADPSCNEKTLKAMITEEVLSELHKANLQVEKLKLRVESLEIENKTLSSLSTTTSLTKSKDSHFEQDHEAISEIHIITSQSYAGALPIEGSAASASPDVTVDFSKLELEYKLQLDEFDKALVAIKREKDKYRLPGLKK